MLILAYPLPRIDEIVNSIAKYQIYNTVDLRSAYYQIPLSNKIKFLLHLKQEAIHKNAIQSNKWHFLFPTQNG